MNGVSSDAIRLWLFPFSLRYKAKLWLISLAPNFITSWNAFSNAFFTIYYPLGKTTKYCQDLAGFKQQPGESLYDVWERFKDLQKHCPHHAIPDWLLIQTFY